MVELMEKLKRRVFLIWATDLECEDRATQGIAPVMGLDIIEFLDFKIQSICLWYFHNFTTTN